MEAVCSRGSFFRTVILRLESVNRKKYAASTFRYEIGFLRSNTMTRTGVPYARWFVNIVITFVVAKKYEYDGKKPL